MNSTFLKNNLAQILKELDKDCARMLLQKSLALYEANKSGDAEKIRNSYRTLLAQVQMAEKATGIPLISAPDGSFLCALNGLAYSMYAITQKEMTKTFDTIEEANWFLYDKTNIIVTKVSLKTKTTLGLLANHTAITQVTITYKAGNGDVRYRYGIWQEEKTGLFLRRDADQYVQKWLEINPDVEYVTSEYYRNSRGSVSSVAFGLGTDYVEHVNHVITYRQQLDNARPGMKGARENAA